MFPNLSVQILSLSFFRPPLDFCNASEKLECFPTDNHLRLLPLAHMDLPQTKHPVAQLTRKRQFNVKSKLPGF